MVHILNAVHRLSASITRPERYIESFDMYFIMSQPTLLLPRHQSTPSPPSSRHLCRDPIASTLLLRHYITNIYDLHYGTPSSHVNCKSTLAIPPHLHHLPCRSETPTVHLLSIALTMRPLSTLTTTTARIRHS